jgi:hypothetical protein
MRFQAPGFVYDLRRSQVKQIRKRLTYANVMSTIAVFLVLGGATAFAASELGKNTVGSKQIKSNAVTTGKIKKEAVTGGKIKNGTVSSGKIGAGAVTTDKLGNASVNAGKIAGAAVTEEKIANDAVTGAKVKDGSLTGADVNQNTLNLVKAANVYSTEFDEGPNTVVNPSDPGVKSGGCFLVCIVEFPRNVTKCTSMATPVGIAAGSGEASFAEAFPSSTATNVIVEMFNKEGTITAHDFSLTVICPTSS